MPTFCALSLFVMYVLPNLGDGVIWNYRMQSETSVCETNFWSNIFCMGDIPMSNKEVSPSNIQLYNVISMLIFRIINLDAVY